MPRTDPGRGWREKARRELQPCDSVLTESPRSVCLLTVRGGPSVDWLPAHEWPEAEKVMEAAEAAGSGLDLDGQEVFRGSLETLRDEPFLQNARRLER